MSNQNAGAADDDNLPKLSLFRLSLYIADLLLVSEGSVEWVKEPRIRFIWHLLFFSMIGIILAQRILIAFLDTWVENSPTSTFVWRCFSLACWVWLLSIEFVFAYRHYRYMLLTGKDLRFKVIIVFSLMSITYFGYIYRDLYILSPDLFHHSNPIFVPKLTRTMLEFPTYIYFFTDFILYSACTAVSVDYPRITSASALISFVNFAQIIGSLLMTALLIATFVEKTSRK